MKRQRIVTMCQGGHVRSVALKYLLRYGGPNLDVLACGWESNTEQTRRMLFEWADTIIILQSKFEQHVPSEFHDNSDGSRRLFCYDVGEDRFGNPFHPELQEGLKHMIASHGLFAP